MSNNLINTIQSLNSRSFADYQHLVFDLKDVITKYKSDIDSNFYQNKDLQKYESNKKSLHYITKLYNDKLEEFTSNFFSGEELIRKIINSDSNILNEIKSKSYSYFMALPYAPIQLYNGPSALESSRFKQNLFEQRYNSKYFLEPKPVAKESNQGCFIATYAFDSYEHEHVLMLRRYRDEHLLKNYLGISFVKLYYRYSPRLVAFFEYVKLPKNLIRQVLKMYLSLLQFVLQKKF